MSNDLSGVSKIFLELYYKVWEEVMLLNDWKEAIIIPICKPGKDPNSVVSYRALTSCICKL